MRASPTNEVEVLSLHKLDYDRFVKDIQQAERREQFNFYRALAIFFDWQRDRVERLANSTFRRDVEDGQIIFRQGDVADYFYFVFEGKVELIKEVQIVSRNRWPQSLNRWDSRSNRSIKEYPLFSVTRGQPFGEHSVLENGKSKPKIGASFDKSEPSLRPSTAIARGKTTVLVIDRLEMAHHLMGCSAQQYDRIISKERISWDDEAILKNVGKVEGGPSSTARAGDFVVHPNKAQETIKVGPLKNPSSLPFTERAAILMPPSTYKGKHKQAFVTSAQREKEFKMAKDKEYHSMTLDDEREMYQAAVKADEAQQAMVEALMMNAAIRNKEQEVENNVIKTALHDEEKRRRMGLLNMCDFEGDEYGSPPTMARPKSAYAHPSLGIEKSILSSGSNGIMHSSLRMSQRSSKAKAQLSYTFASGQCLGDIWLGKGRTAHRSADDRGDGADGEREKSAVYANIESDGEGRTTLSERSVNDAPEGPFVDTSAPGAAEADMGDPTLCSSPLLTHSSSGGPTRTALTSSAPGNVHMPRISHAGRRPATAATASSRRGPGRAITYTTMQRNLKSYPKMFATEGTRVPLAGVVLSNVVTTQSGRRSRTSCLAGVAEFDGPHTADAADRARHERSLRNKKRDKKMERDIVAKEDKHLLGKGDTERESARAEREMQRLLRMSDITDVLVRRRSRPG